MHSSGDMALSDTAGEAHWEGKPKIKGIIVENLDCPTVWELEVLCIYL